MIFSDGQEKIEDQMLDSMKIDAFKFDIIVLYLHFLRGIW